MNKVRLIDFISIDDNFGRYYNFKDSKHNKYENFHAIAKLDLILKLKEYKNVVYITCFQDEFYTYSGEYMQTNISIECDDKLDFYKYLKIVDKY